MVIPTYFIAAPSPGSWSARTVTTSGAGRQGRSVDQPLRPSPLVQLGLGLVAAQRARLQPQFLQVLPRLPDQRTRRDAEQPHDLVAVQVGPDLGQILGRLQLDNAPLEVVVGPLQGELALPVAGRAVR